jgi:nitroreductase
MTVPDVDLDQATVKALLTTTRSVRRRLDLDAPLDLAEVRACLGIALQAPNGSNSQVWRWILVTDPAQRRRLGDLYRRANAEYAAYLQAHATPADLDAQRSLASSTVLWDRLAEVPALLVACYERPDWFDGSTYAQASMDGSVFPAIWSFMLACRARGIGTCLVTSHLRFEREVAEILELPETFGQAGLVAIARLRGHTFQPAARAPLEQVLRTDRWGR